jgi:hypothetical protein
VVALAPDAASAAAARRLALPAQWSDTGCDERAVWGRYRGTGAEPYEVAVELEEAASRCSCLSRKSPCKHALGLLLLWSAHAVLDDVARPPSVGRWLRRRSKVPAPAAVAVPAPLGPSPSGSEEATGAPSTAPDRVPAARLGTEVGGSAGRAGGGAATDEPLAQGAGDVADGVAEELDDGPAHDRAVDPVPEGDGLPPELGRRVAERAARVAAGLGELDRWLADQVRTGLADAGLDRPEPWEAMAARLVDAQAGSMANRLRRLAVRVAATPDHHELVVAELGLLHLLARGGRRTVHLPGPLADAVRAAVGWTVRQDDVRAQPPITDRWLVAGRSDVQEDRIVVRRTWLRGMRSGRWAMVLAFAAYGQALDGGLPVGADVDADVHFYPSARPLRALLGVVHAGPRLAEVDPGAPPIPLPAVGLAQACDEAGAALAAEPWLERWPVAVRAAPALHGGRWVLADADGSLPVAPDAQASPGLMDLIALSGGRPLALTAEWTADGVVPLAAHLADRVVDVGPFGPWGYG